MTDINVGRRRIQDLLVRHCWQAGLLFMLSVGAVLRLIWGFDIEYKGDESFNFDVAQHAGRGAPLPSLGMISSSDIPNPGMSVWIFILLSRLFHVQGPVDLARAVQLLNVGALLLLTFLVVRFVEKDDREPWLWAIALACVNPLDLLLQRKIWAPSVFPIVTTVMLVCWWKRERFWAALVWGLLGALLGQIQMTGFSYAFAFFLFTLLFARKSVNWSGWVCGSVLGLVPLIPWISYQFHNLRQLKGTYHASQMFVHLSLQNHPFTGWIDTTRLQFFLVWIVNSLGVGLDYSLHAEALEFLKYPYVAGVATHLVLITTVIDTALFAVIVFCAAARLVRERNLRRAWLRILDDDLSFGTFIAFAGFGGLICLTPYFVQRHYLLVTFPYEFVWLASIAMFAFGPRIRMRRLTLAGVCICQLFLSVSFLWYIHINHGAPHGDFGVTFGAQGVSALNREVPGR